MDVTVALVLAALWTCDLGVHGASDPDLEAPPVPDTDNHLPPLPLDGKTHLTSEIVKQMITKRCAHQYSLPCLKLDLARLVDRLAGTSASFQLLPGVSVRSHNVTRSEEFPVELAQALARDNGHHSLDEFLITKLSHYIGSLTLSVQLAEPAAFLASRALAVTSEEGRRRKNGLGGLMTAGLFSGGTLMAVGMSALAALAGKALMTALLSLMLSALAAMKGGGDSGGGKTTYEIIAKPIVTHAHTHSSEVQHEVHGGHHHAYAYARSLDFNPVLPAGIGVLNDTQDSYTLAYRAQRPANTQTPAEVKE